MVKFLDSLGVRTLAGYIKNDINEATSTDGITLVRNVDNELQTK